MTLRKGGYLPYAIALLVFSSPAFAAILYVDGDSSGAKDGSSWADAFLDLQSALAAATAGDEIWVAAGTYTPAGPDGDREATFQLASGVEIYGGFAGTEVRRNQRDPLANLTILSGDLNANDATVSEPVELANEATRQDNSFNVVTGTGADGTAVLDGFTITGGHAVGSRHSDGAGMIYSRRGKKADGPTLVGCTFEWNFARSDGGGIYNARGNLTLQRCNIRNNHADNFGQNPTTAGIGGGGMHSRYGDPLLIDCTFVKNTTRGHGAGMLSYFGSPILVGCEFERNRVVGSAFRMVGGGLWLREPGKPLLVNCSFIGNIAQAGAGIAMFHGTNPTIINTMVSGNVAEGSNRSGAGILLNSANATLVNCTITGNRNRFSGGGAVGFDVAHEAFSIVRNCIFWGNISGQATNRFAQLFSNRHMPDVSHSCVQGGWSRGKGNIADDPLFTDADGPDDIPGTADDDLRLKPGSPCIDAGDNRALAHDRADVDADGDISEAVPLDVLHRRRVLGGTVDMGAYEFGLELVSRWIEESSQLRLEWESEVKARYQLLRSVHGLSSFEPWGQVFTGTGEPIVETVSVEGEDNAFYRVQVLPPSER